MLAWVLTISGNQEILQHILILIHVVKKSYPWPIHHHSYHVWDLKIALDSENQPNIADLPNMVKLLGRGGMTLLWGL